MAKCGICGATTNPNGTSIYDMAGHKARQHPTEYQEAKNASLVKRRATARAKEELLQRKRKAGEAASRVTVLGTGGMTVGNTSRLSRYNILEVRGTHDAARYPDIDLLVKYRELTEEVELLKYRQYKTLQEAYEKGIPVPLADWEAVQKIMEDTE